MVNRESDIFRVTPESRGEHLGNWSDDELRTLKDRLMEENYENERVVEVVDQILMERGGQAVIDFEGGRGD